MEGLEIILNARYFVIPANQRGYSWEIRHLEDLRNDLILAGSHAHYLGSIIVSRDPSGDFEDDRMTPTINCTLEDGQQRMTAFFFLLRAAQLRLEEIDGHESVDSQALWNLIAYQKGDEKLRLQNSNAELDACFSNLMIGAPPMPGEKTPPMSAMVRTYDWAERMFSELDRDECVRWKNRLTNKARFIVVDLASAGVDRHLAFDAINSRGLPLSQFDKIKNFCMLIKAARGVAIEPEKLWYRSIQLLEMYSVGTRSNEEAFIAELYSVIHSERTGTSKAHETFVNKYRKLAELSVTALEANLSHFATLWPSYAESFAFLTTGNRRQYYGDKCTVEAGKWLDRLDNLGLPTITRPLLAAGHMNYEPHEFETLIRVCEIFTFRVYAVAGYRIDKKSPDIIDLAHDILSNGKSLDDVLKVICTWLSELAPMRFIVQQLANGEPKYSFAPGGWQHGYYFLYEYEVGVSPSGVSPLPWGANPEEKRNTQEHILPKEHRDGGWWESHWQDESKAEKFKNRLGNLVLTAGNSILARKSIDLKLDDSSASYSFNSTAATNSEKLIRDYTDGTSWNEKNILSREQDMLKFAVDRWSIPCCSDNEIAYLPEEFEKNIDQKLIEIQKSTCIGESLSEEEEEGLLDEEFD